MGVRDAAYEPDQQHFGVQVWRGYTEERPWSWRTVVHGQVLHTATAGERRATAEEAFAVGMQSLIGYLHHRATSAQQEAEMVARTCVIEAQRIPVTVGGEL